MVSPNRFRAMNYYIDPQEHIQMFQFDTQEYVFSMFLNFIEMKYVMARLDKETELDDFKFFDYENHKNIPIRQFITEVLDFGDVQVLIKQDEEYKLNSPLSQNEPVQFTVLA